MGDIHVVLASLRSNFYNFPVGSTKNFQILISQIPTLTENLVSNYF